MGKTTKVMVVIPDVSVGGGERLAVETIHNIHNENMVFKLVSLYPRRDTVLADLIDSYGIDVTYLHKKRGFDFNTIRELGTLIKDFQPDTIHGHLRVMLHLLWPMMRHKVKNRLYTVHNMAEKDGRGITKHVLKVAFGIGKVKPVAISNTCKKSIESFYHLKGEKIPCVFVGTDVTKFQRREDYSSLDSSLIQFVAVGRLTEQKNYPLMIEAFEKLYRMCPNVHLYIVGGGEQLEELRDMVQSKGLSDVISIPGIVPEVKDYLEQAHVYLMTSDWEGLPQTILEAMAMGLPIVSTKAGGVEDVVEHKKNGLLVEIGDLEGVVSALHTLACDKEKRQSYSDYSLMLAQKYSIQNSAKQYERLYLGEDLEETV